MYLVQHCSLTGLPKNVHDTTWPPPPPHYLPLKATSTKKSTLLDRCTIAHVELVFQLQFTQNYLEFLMYHLNALHNQVRTLCLKWCPDVCAYTSIKPNTSICEHFSLQRRNRMFASVRNVQKHSSRAHKQKKEFRYQCPVCPIPEIKTRAGKEYHIRNEHPDWELEVHEQETQEMSKHDCSQSSKEIWWESQYMTTSNYLQ